VKLAGDLTLPEEEFRKAVKVKPGDVFSREKLNESTKAISDKLGAQGYAFANVNAAPELDKEKAPGGVYDLCRSGEADLRAPGQHQRQHQNT
jgi:outer membrane protein assembly factor BamA